MWFCDCSALSSGVSSSPYLGVVALAEGRRGKRRQGEK
jgi:hypothetical protein